MITVQLHDLNIHAAHGVYEGEENVGNPFIVNLDVSYDEGDSDLQKLENTIDYVDLYEIVHSRMMVPSGLLEKLCETIIRHIRHQYPFVTEVSLSIYKLQPPIRNFHGKVGVSMTKRFER